MPTAYYLLKYYDYYYHLTFRYVNVLLGLLKIFLHIKVLLSPQRYQKIRHITLLAMFQEKFQNSPNLKNFCSLTFSKWNLVSATRKLLWRNSANLSPAKQTDELTYLTVSLSSLVSYLRIFCECPVSVSLGNLISYFVIFCTSKTQDDYVKHVNSKISSCLGVLSSFLFSLVSIHSVWVTSHSPLTLTYL